MPAPGTLYGEGAQLLGEAGRQASDIASGEREKTKTTVQAGEAAAGETGATARQISAQQAQMALEKLKLSENHVQITPQIALGLARTTGDKEWMQAIGTSMRPDVLLGLYTHGMELAHAKKAPKITQIYDANGKIRHSVVYTDEQGNIQQLMLDEGITPEALNKGKGGKGGKGGAAGSEEFKNKKEFNRAYEKRRTEYSDPIRAEEIKKTNPEKYDADIQWLKDNQDTYDANVRAMGKGGAGAASGGSGGASTKEEAPFDADAFIKDALGQ